MAITKDPLRLNPGSKMVKFDVKSVMNSEVMILYLDSVVRITSHVQMLILDLVSNPYKG